MKKLFSFLFVWLVGFSVYAAEPDSLLVASNSSSEPIDKEHCTCKGIPLYGKVRVVDCFADFKVEVVSCFADLNVKIVDVGPSSCGQWEFVSIGEDFTVEFVSCFGDFTIEYVDISSGAR